MVCHFIIWLLLFLSIYAYFDLVDHLMWQNSGEQEKKIGLKWIDRYKVAVGIAEALDYLHGSNNAQPAIHRDVKSSNILLTSDFEPQV